MLPSYATVADLIAVLRTLDPALPVVAPTPTAGPLVYARLTVEPARAVRQASPETVDTFCGRPSWCELGTPQSQYHETHGGGIETVVVLRPEI